MGAKIGLKTHLGPQSADVVMSCVLGAKGSGGEVKLSTLKQFGLLDGPSTGYFATDLAKKIASAPEEDQIPLIRIAALKPSVFKGLFDTFHGDEVSKSRIKQRAADLKVHPDLAEKCVDLYLAAAVKSQLVSINSDKVTHVPSTEAVLPEGAAKIANTLQSEQEEDPIILDSGEDQDGDQGADQIEQEPKNPQRSKRNFGANFQVNLSLDSTMDSEKLQKQLELLRKFGVI